MDKRIYCIVVAASFALNIAAVQAKPIDPKNMEMHLKEMDTNNDGSISKAEFDAAHSKYFQELDTDKDNKLSMQEMKAGHQTTGKKGEGRGFDAADTDSNGELTREEVKDMPRLQKNFDKMDTNKDGKLTRAEMDAAMQKRRSAGE